MQRVCLPSNGIRLIFLITTLVAGFLLIQTLTSSNARAGELTMNEFEVLHRQLQVPPDKPWRTIPWKTALLDAQQTAARQGKPIFIWAMDGHPLGCT
jgi:hypothetical protein